VTHHVLALYIPPGKTAFEMAGGLRDGSLVGAGYFAVQVPGCRPNVFPEGTGKLLQKGARFLFQLHYTPNGKATTDQTQMGLRFCKKKPEREVKTSGIFSINLRIPPNDPAATFTAELAFKKPIDLISMFPHMHVRGSAFKYERVSGPKDERVATTLLDVPKYDFNWQNFYRPEPMDGRRRDPHHGRLRQLEEQPLQSQPQQMGRLGRPDVRRDDDRVHRLPRSEGVTR